MLDSGVRSRDVPVAAEVLQELEVGKLMDCRSVLYVLHSSDYHFAFG